MTTARLSHSLTNIAHFATRVPQALRRRTIGQKYLAEHPGLAREYVMPRADRVRDAIAGLAPALPIRHFAVDRAGYEAWVRSAGYPLLAYHTNSTEKYLEHYVSVELMGARPGGTLVDIASCRSYFPHLMRRRGFRVIVQDLVYRPGLHGDFLGCNAADMPLPAASVDAMTLHCSFEHFEGSADMGFVRECGRLLKPGGVCVIVPLYLHEEQLTWTDPYFHATGEAHNDPGATWQPAVGYSNAFGRMYSPQTFVERVVAAVAETTLRPTLYVIDGVSAVGASCYLQFALTLEQPPSAAA